MAALSGLAILSRDAGAPGLSGDEKMAELARAAFTEVPAGFFRPQGGEFRCPEAGLDGNDGIMAGDVIATD